MELAFRIWLARVQIWIHQRLGYPYKFRCQEPGCYFRASANTPELLDRVILIHMHEETTDGDF